MAKFFYFCHLKKLIRPETFGPYYVLYVSKGKIAPVYATTVHGEVVI